MYNSLTLIGLALSVRGKQKQKQKGTKPKLSVYVALVQSS